MTALAGLGAVIVALSWGGLALHVPGAVSVGSPRLTNVFVALLVLAGVVYLVAVRQVLRRPPGGRRAILLVALVAAAMRLPLVPVQPFLSSDVYRYVWDGRVQDAWINPYRYIPAAPQLKTLRDRAIYPHVNRRTYARTIYPPAAEMVFAGVGLLGRSVIAMKLAMLAFEAAGMACALLLLRRAGLPRARLLIYAWNPLAAWSFAGNGHVDAIAVGLVGLALLARADARRGWAGAALGAATLTKFLPVAIGPALWRPWDWRLPAAFLAVIVLLYLPYLGAGAHVLGFLPHYASQEDITSGPGIWLLAGIDEVVPVGREAALIYLTLAALALLCLGFWLALRPRPSDAAADVQRICGDAAILGACTIAAMSPHYPWYFVWLALPACVQPYRAVVWLSAAPLILYLDPWNEQFFWRALVYVPMIALAVLDVRQRRRALAPRLELAAQRSPR
ncbi:MAG: glycosyltransferase 87 family protein [Acetobacteraceae bacterium]